MQIPPDVLQLDQERQLVGSRQLHFARPFAQLRWNPGQADRGVHFFFGPASQVAAFARPLERSGTRAIDGKDAVLVELQSLADGDRAQLDVVFLRAGEVLQGGAKALWRHYSQVDLYVGDGKNRRPGIAGSEDLLCQWQ